MPVTSNMIRAFMILVSSAVLLGMLFWLQAVLVPIALAILLTFMLSPLVSILQSVKIPRTLAVAMVVGIAFSAIVAVGWMLGKQVTSFVDTFPQYEQNFNSKLAALQPAEGGFFDKIQRIVTRVSRQLDRQSASRETAEQRTRNPQPVKVVESGTPFGMTALWSALGPILEPFALVGLSVILVVFMLLRREDLRDRVISIVGHGHLTLTTKALDEAGDRISRYLLMQLIVNGSYGVAVAIGLFFIGVPYALLWGFLAAVLRYIPYLGAWIAAILPVGLSLLVAEGWSAPLLVLILFLTLELISNMLIEPWLYGRGIGVSETATLIMIAFWTWLWGPIGLVLATPLTVCLLVAGKYVPFLSVLDTLLGDKPALEPETVFYQRLLARDDDEANDIAETYLEKASLITTFDAVLITALVNSKRDLEREVLNHEEQRAVVGSTRQIAEQLATVVENRERQTAIEHVDALTLTKPNAIRMLAIPARDESDKVGLDMLAQCLDSTKIDISILNHGQLASDVIANILDYEPAMVCIVALPPGGGGHARLLCLRLRARFPQLKVLVGRWGYSANEQKMREQLLAAGATDVAITLDETFRQIETLRTLTLSEASTDKEVTRLAEQVV